MNFGFQCRGRKLFKNIQQVTKKVCREENGKWAIHQDLWMFHNKWLASLVRPLLRVHQELHACLISSLAGHSCHLQTSYLPGILFFLEITVTQKPFWIIGVSAWLVVKWYHHVCCSDDFCRREDQLPFLSVYFWFQSVLQLLFVCVNAKVNG